MQFYLLMFIITFLFIAAVLHVINRINPFELYEDGDVLVPSYIAITIASLVWFIAWPLAILGATCYLLFKLLDKLFLRKYLKKDKPNV